MPDSVKIRRLLRLFVTRSLHKTQVCYTHPASTM